MKGPNTTSPSSAPQDSVSAPVPQFGAPQVAVAAPQFPGRQGQSAAAHQTPVEWLRGRDSAQPTVQWLPRLKCNFCRYETNNQNELVYHIESKHQQPKLKCDNCPQSFENSEALVCHIVQAHTRNQQRERNILSNGRWTCSFCSQEFSGDQARDNHMCGHHPVQLPTLGPAQQQRGGRDRSQEDCTRGPQCRFLQRGNCHFRHAQNVENLIPAQVTTRSTGRRDMWCAYQDKCNRKETCGYKHLENERDFLQSILRRTLM